MIDSPMAVVLGWPQYQCHKKVWALKIAGITDPNAAADGSRLLAFEEPADGPKHGPLCADGSYMTKHDPRVGGYYVIYEDGYASYSPASAFESGYARC